MASAAARTFASSTAAAQTFHEFQPSGGVCARASTPPTIVISPAVEPAADVTVTWTTVLPAAFSAPVIMPVAESNIRPSGRLLAANVMGPSPEAGIRNRNGRPGVAPVTRGALISGTDALI